MTVADLRAACDAVLKDPSLQPGAGITHCNQAVRAIAIACGCHDFPEGMLANEMIDLMASSWVSVPDGADAQAQAFSGRLVVAGVQEEEHGHVAVIYPMSRMAFSPSWSKLVPWVANVGKTVGQMPLTHAFPVDEPEPDYYLWPGASAGATAPGEPQSP